MPPNDSSDDAPSTKPVLESWERIAAFVEPFLEQWESGNGPPLLEEFVPNEVSDRREVLIELVKVDIDYRQQYGLGGNLVEDYATVFPELLDSGKYPVDLIVEEFQIRQANGESVRPSEYFDRFPQQRSELAKALAFASDSLGETLASTLPGRVDHASFDPGDRVGDFYLMSKLGQGGFATVYLARQEEMQRLVALKVSADKGSEAQTLAQLDHPHIIRVFDQSRLPEKQLLLLYMQFAPGGTLHALLAKSREVESKCGRLVAEVVGESLAKTGVISPNDLAIKPEIAEATWPALACHYGMELAAALHYAHQHGILHRDLKPANVLLDAYGSCKLADFNISFSSELSGQNAATSFGGSVAYMPPEQLAACHPFNPGRPEDLDERSDLFALAVLLWEFSTGERPYDETDLGGTWSEVLETMMDRRRSMPTHGDWPESDCVAQSLRAVLFKCLRPEKHRRFRSAKAFSNALVLCSERRVAELVHTRNQRWKSLACRWPVATVVLATLLPNAVAAWFAWLYNHDNLEQSLADATTMSTFNTVQSIINGIAFPVAFAVLVWLALPLRSLLRDEVISQDRPDCSRLFRLGLFGAGLGIVEWTIAAFAYPITLHILLGGLPFYDWGHFIFSHVISGMIAAAYPFFLLNIVVARAFLPRWLMSEGRNSTRCVDTQDIDRLTTQLDWFLLVAGAVPAVGVFVLVMMLEQTSDHHRFALKALSVMGAFGFAAVFQQHSRLKKDLAAYQRALEKMVD